MAVCFFVLVSSYCLFASISTLLKEDMAQVLECIVMLMITSINSTEGIKVRPSSHRLLLNSSFFLSEEMSLNLGYRRRRNFNS